MEVIWHVLEMLQLSPYAEFGPCYSTDGEAQEQNLQYSMLAYSLHPKSVVLSNDHCYNKEDIIPSNPMDETSPNEESRLTLMIEIARKVEATIRTAWLRLLSSMAAGPLTVLWNKTP